MFYEKLKNELKKRKISLNQLAQKTGISQPTTTKWKNGGLPGASALIKICEYLHVSADYLLDLDNEDPPPQLSEDEIQLILNFRECDSGTQKSILILATSGAAESESKEKSSISKNIG